MKLLVRTTNWLGDAVMSIPALREIRRVYADAEITLLTRPWMTDLYAREDFCDAVIGYENSGRHRGPAGKWRLGSELRRGRFDQAILLQNAFDAALSVWLGRIPRRIGYARDGRRPLLTDPITVPARGEIPPHQRFYYLELLRRAGLIEELPDSPDIRLSGTDALAADGRADWRRRGFEEERWIGVSPGAAFGGAKRWLAERFAEAAGRLSRELDAGVAVFGTPGEAELAGQVAELAGPRAYNLAGKTTLVEFLQLAAACTVYLTNDSGSMHVAVATGVPTVAVFGATDHIATGPASASARVVRHDVDCSPCLLRECPIDHPCMQGVGVEMVVESALSLLVEHPAEQSR